MSGTNAMGYESQIGFSIIKCQSNSLRRSLLPNIACRNNSEIEALLAKNSVNVKIYPISATMNPNDFSDDPI